MKILQINKYFRPKGGAEIYFFNLLDLLKKNQQVILSFAQKHDQNLSSDCSQYFISDLDLSHLNSSMLFRWPRLFWSPLAQFKVRRLIQAQRPEIVHIHNIYHQLSPSILYTIKKQGLPIVMTVHDFKLVKPDYTLRADNSSSGKGWLAQLILTLEFNLHNILRSYQRHIDCYIAPSQFVKDQLVTGGYPASKIQVIPHFIDLTTYQPSTTTGDYLFFAGRLDESKGVDTLLYALKELNQPTLKLKIAGRGPAKDTLQALTRDLGLADQVEFLGFVKKDKLINEMSRSLAVVCPSRVHETFGLSVLEAMALAKPVIGAKVGAYPELIKHQLTGLLFEVNNAKDLAKQINKLANNFHLAQQLGQAGRQAAEQYTPEQHYQQIMSVYDRLIKQSPASLRVRQFELEKKYAQQILTTSQHSHARLSLIQQANDEVMALVDSYTSTGIDGQHTSTLKMIKKIVQPGAEILDFGCGQGELVKLLNQAGYSGFGYEISPHGRQIAQELLSNNNLTARILTQDQFVTKKFDLIVLDNVIEHLVPDEIDNLITKFKQILTDQGQILIITPHRLAGPHDISRYFLPVGSQAQGLHLREYTVSDLKQLLDRHGLQSAGYIPHPRLTQKLGIQSKPSKNKLNLAILLERIISSPILVWSLRINRTLSRLLVGLMFPAILVAKK